jgi:hypothetical protein
MRSPNLAKFSRVGECPSSHPKMHQILTLTDPSDSSAVDSEEDVRVLVDCSDSRCRHCKPTCNQVQSTSTVKNSLEMSPFSFLVPISVFLEKSSRQDALGATTKLRILVGVTGMLFLVWPNTAFHLTRLLRVLRVLPKARTDHRSLGFRPFLRVIHVERLGASEGCRNPIHVRLDVML